MTTVGRRAAEQGSVERQFWRTNARGRGWHQARTPGGDLGGRRQCIINPSRATQLGLPSSHGRRAANRARGGTASGIVRASPARARLGRPPLIRARLAARGGPGLLGAAAGGAFVFSGLGGG
jgi:hypothetical protein